MTMTMTFFVFSSFVFRLFKFQVPSLVHARAIADSSLFTLHFHTTKLQLCSDEIPVMVGYIPIHPQLACTFFLRCKNAIEAT